MKIVILEANSLGKDIDLKVFENLGVLVIYDQSDAKDTPEKLKDADEIISLFKEKF